MLPEPFNLEGRRAVMASLGGKLTRALASALLEAGASLALVLPSSKSSDGIVESLKGQGADVICVPWDPKDVPGLRGSVEEAVSRLEQVDILVNDLSTKFARPFKDMTGEEWHRVIQLNLDSVFYACKGVAPHMLARHGGRIVNVASALGARVVVNESAYCTAMGGVLQLTRALGLEWARDNIRVNAIAPGWISDSPDELPDSIRRYIPMQRWGRPEDLGGLLVYLASESCSFTTGETIFVDGGVMIRT